MSLFNNLFGIRKENPISPQQVIQNMRETLSTIERREVFLEKRILAYKKDARLIVGTNKQKAIALLKKAKMNEKQLESIYGQKDNIEIQILTLEQGISNKNTISALKQGKNAIKNLQESLNPDNVVELIDDIADNINGIDEISTAISTPIGQLYDDDELLNEFEQENDTQKSEQHTYQKSEQDDISLLAELDNFPVKKIKTEEQELDELQELMNM